MFENHDAFNADTVQAQELEERSVAGKVGNVEVKRRLVEALDRFLDPIRERRGQFARQPELVYSGLSEGSRHVRQVARKRWNRFARRCRSISGPSLQPDRSRRALSVRNLHRRIGNTCGLARSTPLAPGAVSRCIDRR